MKKQKQSQMAKAQRHKWLVDLNEFAQKNQTVFAGDSITQGYPIDEMFPGKIIYNRGNSGYKTYEMLDAFEESILKIYPEKLFVLIGTNDMSMFNKTPSMALSNLSTMIDMAKDCSEKMEIYLISVYPVNVGKDKKILKNVRRKSGFYPDKIIKLNELYEKLAEEKKITYVDVYSKIVDSEGMMPLDYTTDGVHLSVAGYKAISHILKQYL